MTPNRNPDYAKVRKGIGCQQITEGAMARPKFRFGARIVGPVWTGMWWKAAAVMIAVSCGPAMAADQPQEDVDGARLYRHHCASCHGATGMGDGPIAEKLKVPPPALATLARRNAGTFPAEYVHHIIDGRQARGAHGGRDMPVWGTFYGNQARWQSRNKANTEEVVQQRITALMDYLETLQVSYTTGASAEETAATESLLTQHLAALRARDMNGVMRGYTEDSVLVIPSGALHGVEEIAGYYRALFTEFAKPGAAFDLAERTVVGNVAHISWSGETADTVYERTDETFSVEDGKIRYQISAFRSRAKK